MRPDAKLRRDRRQEARPGPVSENVLRCTGPGPLGLPFGAPLKRRAEPHSRQRHCGACTSTHEITVPGGRQQRPCLEERDQQDGEDGSVSGPESAALPCNSRCPEPWAAVPAYLAKSGMKENRFDVLLAERSC